jgi:hypothetical protein
MKAVKNPIIVMLRCCYKDAIDLCMDSPLGAVSHPMDYLDYKDLGMGRCLKYRSFASWLKELGAGGYLFFASWLKEQWHQMPLYRKLGQGCHKGGRHVPLLTIEIYRTDNTYLFLLGFTITGKCKTCLLQKKIYISHIPQFGKGVFGDE